MKRDVMVETGQVAALRDAVTEALGAGPGHPAMVMAWGEAGTGKTIAARMLYVECGGIYLRALEGTSPAAFLQDICFEAEGSRPHGAARCKTAILGRLREEPAPIFMDEADRLHVSLLEHLRDIHDITGSPVILIGEMGLPARVSARARINDRIPQAFRVAFRGIRSNDVLIYAEKAADLALTPEAAGVVCDFTKGNFRRVHNAVFSLYKAARGNKEVSADMARAVLGRGRDRALPVTDAGGSGGQSPPYAKRTAAA